MDINKLIQENINETDHARDFTEELFKALFERMDELLKIFCKRMDELIKIRYGKTGFEAFERHLEEICHMLHLELPSKH